MSIQPSVLVRAFGDEPCRLTVQGIRDGEVVVYRDSPDEAIPYPRVFIYEWDGDLFAELMQAFQRGQKENLTALWSRAKYFTGNNTAH